MTAVFDFYQLAHPEESIGSGPKYEPLKQITLETIANGDPAVPITRVSPALEESGPESASCP